MLEHLKDGFEVVLNGYAPFSKLNMTILKRIIYYIPENILENLKSPAPGDSFDVKMNANYYIGVTIPDAARVTVPPSP